MSLRYAFAMSLSLAAGCAAHAQGWAPQRNVEIVVASAPGGSNDRVARQVEKVIVDNRLIGSTLTVVHKPGGGGNIAYNYVHQHAGDAHYLLVGTSALLANQISGSSSLSYAEFTLLASLFNDYTAFVVNGAGSIQAGRDLTERLKKDPRSIATGVPLALGGHNHIAVCLLVKALGANPRDLKTVVFSGANDAVVSLLGGHIDLVATGAGNAAPHVASGKLRVVGVAAPRRLGGALSNVPTWREQGVDLVFGGWRAIIAPRGLTQPQIAYWEGVLRKATQVAEWRTDLEKNFWSDEFVTGAQFRKDLDREFADMKTVMVELGLVKP